VLNPGPMAWTSPALGDVLGAGATKGCRAVTGGTGEAGGTPAPGVPTPDLQPGVPGVSKRLDSPVTPEEACHGLGADQAEELRRQQESLARRAADQDLVHDLACGNFSGSRYQHFQDELGRYGLAVMRGWMYTGTVFRMAASRGYALHPTDHELEVLHRDSEARSDIAIMAVGKALPRFRQQALVERGWNYEGGASIATYFIGATLFDFPNEFRRWRTQRNRWRRQDYGDYTVNGLHLQAASDDPAVLALGNIRVADDLNRITPRAREIIKLAMDGWHQTEIVELLGETSVRAVEGVLHRWRTEEKKRLRQGGDDSGST
jgi:hypothetical protein